MLDTNILIYLLKQQPVSVVERVNRLGVEDRLCMSFFTYAELLKGAARSTRQTAVRRQLSALVQQIPVLYHTSKALCEHFAAHVTHLKSAGTPIGIHDLWIGCHALAENCVLVSNNLREFQRIEGLE